MNLFRPEDLSDDPAPSMPAPAIPRGVCPALDALADSGRRRMRAERAVKGFLRLAGVLSDQERAEVARCLRRVEEDREPAEERIAQVGLALQRMRPEDVHRDRDRLLGSVRPLLIASFDAGHARRVVVGRIGAKAGAS